MSKSDFDIRQRLNKTESFDNNLSSEYTSLLDSDSDSDWDNEIDLKKYCSPLALAIGQHKFETAKKLVLKGFDLEKAFPSINDKYTILDWLLQVYNCSITRHDKRRVNPFVPETIESSDSVIITKFEYIGHEVQEFKELLILILKQDAQKKIINKSYNGSTPLERAIDTNGFWKELIAFGADVNSINSVGDTPLHLASRFAFSLERVVHLLQNGAKKSLNAVNKKGRTPLLISLCNHTPENAKKLIFAGADVTLKDKFDETPLQVAIEKENSHRKSGCNNTALEYASVIQLINFLPSLETCLNAQHLQLIANLIESKYLDRTGDYCLTMQPKLIQELTELEAQKAAIELFTLYKKNITECLQNAKINKFIDSELIQILTEAIQVRIELYYLQPRNLETLLRPLQDGHTNGVASKVEQPAVLGFSQDDSSPYCQNQANRLQKMLAIQYSNKFLEKSGEPSKQSADPNPVTLLLSLGTHSIDDKVSVVCSILPNARC